jgi:soluble cytochrome b562
MKGSSAMSPPLIVLLRHTNGELRTLLARCRAKSGDGSAAQSLRQLLPELAQMTEQLKEISPDSLRDVELRTEMSEYRDRMEQLARVLPKALGQLLAEEGRIENAQARLAAAAVLAGVKKNL